MSRITHIVIALALAAGAMLIGGTHSATAAPGYGASYASSLEIKIKTDCCFGRPADVGIKVTSDAREGASRKPGERPAGDFTGTVNVYLDGELIQTEQVGPKGKGSFQIPFEELKVGRHSLRGEYVPASDSAYQGATVSKRFRVVHCSPDGQLPDTGGDGLLPTTGGPWLGILAIAALLLLAGAWLLRRKRAEG